MQCLDFSKKETQERNRQIKLVRSYFDEKNEILKRRLSRFLSLYPYYGDEKCVGMYKFRASVFSASAVEMGYIFRAFEKEQMYWKSSYVEKHCNYRVYLHIMRILFEMSKILDEAKRTTNYDSESSATVLRRDLNVSNVQVNYLDRKGVRETVPSSANANSWGKQGEEAVDYVLKWLPAEYSVIEKNCSGKYGDNIILLENPSFVDEAQEYDHIVIGPQGIFNIETKNYSGKIAIDKAGNWLRMKRGENEWTSEENPAQQLFRHHVLLQSIVGNHIPIIDVVCMSNPSLIIAGQENSSVPVIKKDLLADFIVGYRSVGLTNNQRKILETRINACKKNCG